MPVPGAKSKLVNINTASFEDLVKVNGIGDSTAMAIIEGRPWARITELIKLRGISVGKTKDLLLELSV